MMNFKNFILNESIHDEYFLNNFKYIVPKNDVLTLLYDFYMVSFLYKKESYNLNTFKKNNYNNLDDYSTAMAQYGKWSQVDYDQDSIDYDTEITNLLNKEVINKLVPYLKEHFLDCLLYSICCEFRHIYDAFYIFSEGFGSRSQLSSEILELIKKNEFEKVKYSFSKDQDGIYHQKTLSLFDNFLRKYNIDNNFIKILVEFFYHCFNNKPVGPIKFSMYLKRYNNQNIEKIKNVSVTIKNQFNSFENQKNKSEPLDRTEISRYSTYLFFTNINITDLELIENFKKIFKIPAWEKKYGGKPWVNICQAYIDLYNAKTIDQQLIQIDHVYDLHHNTGFALNKVYEYAAMEDYIMKALNEKAEAISPYEIYFSISKSFKPLASRLIQSKWNKTKFDY